MPPGSPRGHAFLETTMSFRETLLETVIDRPGLVVAIPFSGSVLG
jgi:hypothetical protein